MILPKIGDRVSLPPKYDRTDKFEVTEVGDDYFLAWISNGGWEATVRGGKWWPTEHPSSITYGDWDPYDI